MRLAGLNHMQRLGLVLSLTALLLSCETDDNTGTIVVVTDAAAETSTNPTDARADSRGQDALVDSQAQDALPNDGQKTELRIMNWNILGSEADLARVAAFIRAYDPDVLLLQEVNVTADRDQVKELAGELGWANADLETHVYFGAADHPGPACGSGNNWVGNAIFSKFPIDERVTHILPRLSSCPNAGSVNRALVGVRVTAPNGQKFNIWNTHLTAGMSGRAPEQRLEQAKWIADYLDHTVPLILGGDFNDVPGSPTHETFLHVGWLDANREAGPTHSASRIDYVWLKRMLFDSAISPALPEPEAGEKKLSDHRPVIVDASF